MTEIPQDWPEPDEAHKEPDDEDRAYERAEARGFESVVPFLGDEHHVDRDEAWGY